MCDPLTLGAVSIGASAGGAVTGIIGANTTRQMNKGYENQKKNATDDLIIENRKRATHDFLREVRLDQLEQAQEESALSEQSNDIAKQASGATGQAVASAAERGVAGNSVEMLVSEYDFQQSQEIGRLRINQNMKNQQHTENIAGSRDQFDYRVAAVKPYVPRPQAPVDYFGPVFGVVSDGAKTAMASGAFDPTQTAMPKSR